MKKFLVAAALVIAPLPAVAADLICAIRMYEGTSMSYYFEKDAQDDMVEIGVEKNGTLMQHAPNRRPIWEVEPANRGAMIMYYVPDRRFRIEITGTPERVNRNLIGASSALFKGGQQLGSGGCGFEDRQPAVGRRRSPTPERF